MISDLEVRRGHVFGVVVLGGALVGELDLLVEVGADGGEVVDEVGCERVIWVVLIGSG